MTEISPLAAATIGSRIEKLLALQPPGRSPLQPFYTDPAIYAEDLERFLFRHWICAGHVSSLAAPGDFFTVEFAGESVILVRGRDNEIRALANVCRHRGSRVCLERSGNARLFICPYHAWAYHLDGSLRAARDMGPEFSREDHGLRQLQVRIAGGLIFFTFADQPPDFSAAQEVITTVARSYGWETAKVALRKSWRIAANWKLAVENYLECYHCGPSHPEFSGIHSNDQSPEKVAGLFAAMQAEAAAQGLDLPETDLWGIAAGEGREPVWCKRFALLDGARSGSAGGAPVAPLMGQFTRYDGGTTYLNMGPVSYSLSYPDHTVIYRFIPHGVSECEMEILWLVHGEAEAGRDYDPEALSWMWIVTSEADKRITEDNQKGVNSRYYQPGPLAVMEGRQRRFVEWYLTGMGRAAG